MCAEYSFEGQGIERLLYMQNRCRPSGALLGAGRPAFRGGGPHLRFSPHAGRQATRLRALMKYPFVPNRLLKRHSYTNKGRCHEYAHAHLTVANISLKQS